LNPWLGILLVLLTLGVALVALHLLERRFHPHPELLRKLMHVLMGLVAATFPWLFSDRWPVLLLAGGSLLLLMLVRGGVSVTRSLRGVLHGIKRTSWGELLFPVSVALVFFLAEGDPVLYSLPVLILALADPVAALIGLYYGKTPFTTLEGSKSIEGSFAFFVITLLCVAPTLLLASAAGRYESLLIGLLMGVVVMMFEAVAWSGLDNLFIPLASFVLLERYLTMDTDTLALCLLVILALGVFLLFWRRHSTLDDSALFGALLVGYGAWAIGDFYWLLVPVTLFILATLLARRGDSARRGAVHTVYTVLAIAAPAYGWLVLGRDLDSPAQFFAYTVVFASHLTMLAISHGHFQRRRLPASIFLSALVQGLVVVVLPFLFKWGMDPRLVPLSAIGALALLLAGGLFLWLQPTMHDCPGTPVRWVSQGAIAAGVSLLAWYAVNLSGPGGELG
jgi:phytol kinase